MKAKTAFLVRKLNVPGLAYLSGVEERAGGAAFDAVTLRHIRNLLSELTADGAEKEFLAVFREIESHADELSAAALAWIRLVEVLAQDTEGRHTGRGRGALKSDEVKWVLAYLLRSGRFRLPRVPYFLQPLAIDVFADITIDALVALLNDYDLMSGRQTSRSSRFWGSVRWIGHRLSSPFVPLFEWLGTLSADLYTAIRFRRAVSPAMRSALAAVEEQGLITQQARLFNEITGLAHWLWQHKGVLVTLARLVGIAITETERFVRLDGPGKKAYAEELVFAVLEDAGLGEGLIGSTLLRTGVDVVIDGVVGIFNDRGLFTHAEPNRASVT